MRISAAANLQKPIPHLEGIRSVLFDLFDTLVLTGNLRPTVTIRHLHRSLRESGFNVKIAEFTRRYLETYRRYRRIRDEELKEVSNNIWVTSTLENFGYHVNPDDPAVSKAVQDQFKPLIQSVKLMPHVSETLSQISRRFKTGLVTNFSYAPAVHQILHRQGIDKFFQTIQISHEVGFRKPHSKIFQAALNSLFITPSETAMVGDSPADILGAYQTGMRSILFHRPGSRYKTMPQVPQPDLIIRDIRSLRENIT